MGVDLNSPAYFFEDRLGELNFDASDWTTPIIREKSIHISVQDVKGQNLLNKLGMIMEELGKSGNEAVCCTPDSLLVEEGHLKFLPVTA